MNNDDFDNFAKIWARAYKSASRGKDPSPDQTSFAFDVLAPFSIVQIADALVAHARCPSDRYGLIPADVVRHIEGDTPTPDQIIGAAMKPRTALAVLCRAEIGSWNLDNWTNYQLRPIAEHCISMLPEWRHRISTGQLTEHECALLDKYEVDTQSARLVGPRQALLDGPR